MDEIDTGAIRLKVSQKATYNITYLEKTILECCNEIDRLIDRFKECREENGVINHLFDLQQTRMKEAVAMWREATGKQDTIPDLGTLLKWIINQLKKCRSNYGDLYQRLKPEIEQRTKETCFKAGWKWIIAYFKGLPLSETNEYRQKSFKQAIDEAKIE